MGMFDRFIKTEERAMGNSNAPMSADDFLHIMGWGEAVDTIILEGRPNINMYSWQRVRWIK